jgi:RHS repeat-associated protein
VAAGEPEATTSAAPRSSAQLGAHATDAPSGAARGVHGVDQVDQGQDGAAPSLFAPPAVSLPKGGGAVRGIGEKFSANPVTGTGSLTIPLPVTPGRSGFGPSLALRYDSGAAHGSFGMGWSLGLPSVTRKTDKGLPTYNDAAESDVFIASDAEDLVPFLAEDGTPERRPRTVDGRSYLVTRYRPRVEGLYARIERWTEAGSGETHWRSISRDNLTTVYGKDANSRIADPADPAGRVFSWLIAESFDAKGNMVVYRYKEEDAREVDTTAAHERNRTEQDRTANRYLKFVRYGNRVSRLVQPAPAPGGWLFELVFDYGEHDQANPKPGDAGEWLCRNDPFSTYRPGFEVRTYRLCQRILMFHHFPDEPGVGADCLVRSMTLAYRDDGGPAEEQRGRRGEPTGALLASVTLTGHRRAAGGGYVSQSLPPLELTYSTAAIGSQVAELDGPGLANLPAGLDGTSYQWVDLDGESIAGVLSEQAGGWFYLPNLGEGRLGPVRTLPTQPSQPLGGGRTQLVDLAGDGQLDLACFDGLTPGFFERTQDQGWAPHRPFRSLPALDWADPNLQLVDLNGDGHADVLVTCDDALVWYPSLGEDGFGPALRVAMPLAERAGPRLVFADGTQSIHLADLSGDGLADLVRVRNGEVCYWPNLGYGRFGTQVVMDHAPLLDRPERFDQRRVRLADLDGTGPTDLVYLGADGVQLYVNQMGNAWSAPTRLAFPPVDDVASVSVVDLLGRGTGCLVWSSALPGNAGRQVRYVDLMGAKPNLLTGVRNNLGGETAVSYAPSTKFYLADKAAGRPWVTRLPFPVHVVEKVETFDWVNRNRFVTRYTYHHGYFDGAEREFRGFGLVEQLDTEQLEALVDSDTFPVGDNVAPASHVPPVQTKTWFHTGADPDRRRIASQFRNEYYPPPDLDVPEAADWLPVDSVLPSGLSSSGEREACRALKGQPLRQEVFALDGSKREPHPYTVVDHRYTVEVLQPPAGDRHGVFAVHPRETLTVTCERDPGDARVAHALVLDVDAFGNVRHAVSVAYGRQPDHDDKLPARTQKVQQATLVTETRAEVTDLVDLDVDDDPTGHPASQDAYRVPVPYDTRTMQVSWPGVEGWRPRRPWEEVAGLLAPPPGTPAPPVTRTLVERHRTRFLADDLAGPLPFRTQQALGLQHETYRLALTADILAAAFGPRVDAAMLTAAGYVEQDAAAPDGGWWVPSGTVRYAPSEVTAPAEVLAHARKHFFLPRRFVDPFGALAAPQYATEVEYDPYDLLPVETVDPAGNRVTAGERNADDTRQALGVDYRVLAPAILTDPNRNRTAISYDALGRVAATAVMGKPEDDTGDRLEGVVPEVAEAALVAFWADPSGPASPDPARDPQSTAVGLLAGATTRIVYDPGAYQRTRDTPTPQPPAVATIAREQHVAAAADVSLVRVGLSYSDGFGREVQHKAQAEPGPLVDGGPDVDPRWVGSGWVVVNNKGKPVRQYEPFFTPHHTFEFAVKVGVSPILCYDPVGRVVATLHAGHRDDKVVFGHSYDKVVFGAWQQQTWDANDTAALPDPAGNPAGNPADDPDVKPYLQALPTGEYLPTWYQTQTGAGPGTPERAAAKQTELHADTPTLACLDPLGRPVLTVAHNRTPADGATPVTDTLHRTHQVLDIKGQTLEVADCTSDAVDLISGDLISGDFDRLVARATYDLAGTRLVDQSMEAGTRRQLTDVVGKPVAVWEYRGDALPDRLLATAHDRLRRPVTTVLHQDGAARTVERTVYGENAPMAALDNLRGRVWQAYDGAGVLTHAYDVKGNPASVARQLTGGASYREVVDWSGTVALDGVTRTARTTFDALNRPTEVTHPDGTVTHPEGTVVRYTYNAAGLLETVRAALVGEAAERVLVANIDYNAKGQRTLVAHGNGVTTTYQYEPATFRLSWIDTRRGAGVDDGPAPPDLRRGVQYLRYVYDPVGNITHIADDAQPRVFNLNTMVEAHADYTYDALYRLVTASGREHLGLINGAQAPTSWDDAPRVNPADRTALGRYTERYTYDLAGNLTKLHHQSITDPATGWTREFTHREPSQLESDRFSNRLTSTQVDAGPPELYGYDAHGNMTLLPPLQLVGWDYRNRLDATSMQRVTSGVPETTYYVYDGAGQRVRKVTDDPAASVDEARSFKERIYLGDFELYREFDPDGNPKLTRTTVHVMDGQQRVALVETPVDGTPGQPLIRYQYANHLGSATVELAADATPISYEEYYPYGSTALAFSRNGTPPKRYRYTAKERDEETGLAYHGARYYAPWLGRWTSSDPSGIVDGTNTYSYVRVNPIRMTDPTGHETDPTGHETMHVPAVSIIPFKGSRPSPPEESSSWGIYAADRARAAELRERYPNSNINFDIDHKQPRVLSPPGSEQVFRVRPDSRNRSEGSLARKEAGLRRLQPDWQDPESKNYARPVKSAKASVKPTAPAAEGSASAATTPTGAAEEGVLKTSSGQQVAHLEKGATASKLGLGLPDLVSSLVQAPLLVHALRDEKRAPAAAILGVQLGVQLVFNAMEIAGRVGLAHGGEIQAASTLVKVGSVGAVGVGIAAGALLDLVNLKALDKPPPSGTTRIYMLGPLPALMVGPSGVEYSPRFDRKMTPG